jgi:phosphonate ABC transporter permease subunit PhnE
MAARNLMIQITSLFGQMVALVAMAPLGWVLGSWAFRGLGSWGAGLIAGGQIPPAAALWAPALLLFTVQAAIPHADNTAPWVSTMRRFGLSVLLAAAAALVLGLVAGLGQVTGTSLAGLLGPFAFFGNFLFVLADSLAVFLPLIGGFTGMFILISLTGVVSEHLLYRAGNSALGKVFTVVMAVLAGAVLVGLPAAFIGWLYELKPTFANLWLPALLGAAALGLVSLALKPTHPMPTGMIIYFASRTILNVLRAIEPLIMAIVFVVWVGIGPFAGVMALMLHTIASLGKLYSEQVENISEGPIEAVTATGANRLQTIIYAVMPQIVPPYIAFTIYRWDINVRMSTIIGFAGGGGIGFLLQQNLNLLKYRQASVQMIAIAIVVSTLDFVSAKIRERIV